MRFASLMTALMLWCIAPGEGHPVDCRLGSIAFERTGYVVDLAHPRAKIVARVLPGSSPDPMFGWIPDDLAGWAYFQGERPPRVVWSSSDPRVVEVDAGGALSAAGVGTATVTATVAGVVPQSATVSVVVPAPGTTILPTRDVLERRGTGLILRRTAMTDRLQPGAVLLSDDGSFVVRVVRVLPGPSRTRLATVVSASREDGLRAGSIAPPAPASCH